MSQVAGDAAQERRKAPWLMLALLYAARDYSESHGIHHWFFLTPNSLARIFKGLGMQLEVTGPACQHRGTRYPHVIKIPSGFDNFELKYPALGQTIPRFNRFQLFSHIKESTKYNTAI
jgi:N-acyl amino acid synthase of PEP-CTERM/exosortase system